MEAIKKIKSCSFDVVLKTILEWQAKLDVQGYDVVRGEIIYPTTRSQGQVSDLASWFSINEDLIIYGTTSEGIVVCHPDHWSREGGYSTQADQIEMFTFPTPIGLLVKLTRDRCWLQGGRASEIEEEVVYLIPSLAKAEEPLPW